MNKYKIKLYAGLVCPRRSLDYKKLEKYFSENGCEIVKKPEDATHIIIITCGFIDRNIQESIDLINTLKKYNAKLIVGGCLKDIAEDILNQNFSGDVITTKRLDKIDDLFPDFSKKLKSIKDANSLHDYHEIDSILGKRKMIVEKIFSDEVKSFLWSKAFIIRIAEGCNCKCTYCSHRNAIGKYISKSVEECIAEFKTGYQNGEKLFRITSMDTGCYGLDIGTNLPSLIDKFIEIADDVKFILEDINPMWMNKYNDEILRLVKSNKIVGFQTPFQSGSPEILKKMKRWNNSQKFLTILKSIKDADPNIHLSTEILLGFPGETEDDFFITMNFLKNAAFDFTYIYPYFENEYVESKNIFPKCSKETIEKRLEEAITFCNDNKISYSIMLNK
jgi:MiaB/RimO family radical SAM methylthiotransferase